MRRSTRKVHSRSTAVRLALVALVTLMTVGGCFHRGRRSVARVVTVHVINQNLLDMVIYTANSGARIRIGTATGLSEGTWDLNLQQLNGSGELQLVADPIGSSRAVLSDVVHVYDGDLVEWTLGSKLGYQAITIR